MRKTLEIIKLMLLQTWRDKSNIIWMIALPVLFSFMAGSMMGDSNGDILVGDDISIAITDEDNSALAQNIIEAIDRNERYVVEIVDEKTLRQGIEEGIYGAGLIIPGGFEISLAQEQEGKQCNLVSMDMSGIAMRVSQIAIAQIERYVTALEAGDIAADYIIASLDGGSVDAEGVKDLVYNVTLTSLKEQWLVDVEYTLANQRGELSEDSLSDTNRMFTGFMIMFIMFTVTYAAGDILDEKKYHTWSRLLAAPVNRVEIMGGKLCGAYLLGIIQMVLLLSIGILLAGVKLKGSIIGALAVMAAFMLTVTGIGLFLSTIVKTMSQLQGLGALIITATSMLAGVFWPIEITSQIMQTIAKFIPQYWAIKGFTDVTVMNASISALWPAIGILLTFATVFFALAVIRLHRINEG